MSVCSTCCKTRNQLGTRRTIITIRLYTKAADCSKSREPLVDELCVERRRRRTRTPQQESEARVSFAGAVVVRPKSQDAPPGPKSMEDFSEVAKNGGGHNNENMDVDEAHVAVVEIAEKERL